LQGGDDERSEEGEKSETRGCSVAATEKLKGKDYERELARLHADLVKLQQWVVHKGLKVCIVFEGRDGKEPDYSHNVVPELTWPSG
jgi:polyphosphate kinase 2 (PPK2 family)